MSAIEPNAVHLAQARVIMNAGPEVIERSLARQLATIERFSATRLERVATAIMVGMLAAPRLERQDHVLELYASHAAQEAIVLARALIAELDKEEPNEQAD